MGERENIKQLFEFSDAGVSILFNWEEKKAVNKNLINLLWNKMLFCFLVLLDQSGPMSEDR